MSAMVRNLRRIASDAAELPVLRWLGQPLYRELFKRDVLPGNRYCGIYASAAQAQAHAPHARPANYDVAEAAMLYPARMQRPGASDYPVVFWLGRLFDEGARRLFDLGGHIGVSYYAFQSHLAYPGSLRWQVHDVPAVMAAGKTWASDHDATGRLSFADTFDEASGSDIVLASGVLQYLDYNLIDRLRALPEPPAHVLINLTPLHPERRFVTLQRITHKGRGIANCSYTVDALAPFIAGFEAAGYAVVDHWEQAERSMRIPFAPEYAVACYHGFYFRRRANVT